MSIDSKNNIRLRSSKTTSSLNCIDKDGEFNKDERSQSSDFLLYKANPNYENKVKHKETYNQSKENVITSLDDKLNNKIIHQNNQYHYTVAEFNKFKNHLLFNRQKLMYRSATPSPNFSTNPPDSIRENAISPTSLKTQTIYETVVQRSHKCNPKIFSIDLKCSNLKKKNQKNQNLLLSSLCITKINK
jgi:hypothetical protein